MATAVAAGTPTAFDIAWEVLDASALSQNLLAALAASRASNLEWGDPSHGTAKQLLKDELLKLQSSKCAYCRRDIKDEPGHLEIDHILPKGSLGGPPRWTRNTFKDRKSTAGYAIFKFVHLNLVLTCKRCNNKKGTYDCRTDRTLPSPIAYPTTPGVLSWVHPYHDAYSAHIRVARGFVYQVANGSPSGNVVIDTCKLASIAALETRAAERKVGRARDANKALLSFASDLDSWDDDQIVAMMLADYPQLNEANLRRSIQGLRDTSIEMMGEL